MRDFRILTRSGHAWVPPRRRNHCQARGILSDLPQAKSSQEEANLHSRPRWSALRAFWLLSRALAEKKYGPGVSDSEIKVAQTIAYSGPASASSVLGKTEAAY